MLTGPSARSCEWPFTLSLLIKSDSRSVFALTGKTALALPVSCLMSHSDQFPLREVENRSPRGVQANRNRMQADGSFTVPSGQVKKSENHVKLVSVIYFIYPVYPRHNHVHTGSV